MLSEHQPTTYSNKMDQHTKIKTDPHLSALAMSYEESFRYWPGAQLLEFQLAPKNVGTFSLS